MPLPVLLIRSALPHKTESGPKASKILIWVFILFFSNFPFHFFPLKYIFLKNLSKDKP